MRATIIMQASNKPILSFCYSNQPLRSYQDLDDVRSTSSYRTEVFTYRSNQSAKTAVQRLNQINPKPKIVLPPPKTKPPPKKLYTQPEEQQQILEKPMLTFDADAFRDGDKEKKGLLDWAGFGLLCGMTAKKESGEGCTCAAPCAFKQEWTKSHQRSDVVAYLKLRGIKPSAEHAAQIEKDVHRTYVCSPTFNRQGIFREMLREVLISYSVYDLELGYVQGLNNIVAALLFHIKDAEKAFWALVELMESHELRSIYVGRLETLQAHCFHTEELIGQRLRDLKAHFTRIGIDIKIVLHGWLLSLMSKLVPLQEMQHVVNGFRKDGWSFVYRLVLAILSTVKDCLLVTEDESDLISVLSQQNFQELGLQWGSIFKEASKVVL